EQMKMFLTRIGFGSRAVVTGDVTQTDLPPGKQSGLSHVINILRGVEGVAFTFFDAQDVVRHPLVQRIVKAYESRSEGKGAARASNYAKPYAPGRRGVPPSPRGRTPRSVRARAIERSACEWWAVPRVAV